MYLCMYAYICVCIYICIYTYVYMYTCMYVCMYDWSETLPLSSIVRLDNSTSSLSRMEPLEQCGSSPLV